MGKRSSKSGAYFDSKDDNSQSSLSTVLSESADLLLDNDNVQSSLSTLLSESADLPLDNQPLDSYLDALYEQRGSTREKGLSLFIQAFKKSLHNEFVEKNFITLLRRYLHSIKVVVQNPSAVVITIATCAWSFILTAMVGRRGLNSKSWQEAVSHFSSFLKKGDRSVRVAAGEALALLYEIGCPEMYSDDDAIQQLNEKILDQVLGLSQEAGGRGTCEKKALSYQWSFFKDVYKFLKVGTHPETSKQIGRGLLRTSTWSELIQLKFLTPFLGDGFLKHMQENKRFHALFEYTPIKHMDSSEKKLNKSLIAASHKEKYLKRRNERDTSWLKKIAQFAVGGT